jgi:hypothetical protein
MGFKKVTPIGLVLAVLCWMQAAGQITFSEVMYDVAANEYHDEFVELFNLSETDSAEVSGWQFGDGTGTDAIIPVYGPARIPPRSFALILDGSYFENSTLYDSVIALGIPVFSISDNALGSGGLSNTTAEYLSITDNNGDTLTTYRYSLNNLPGHSDEKIDLDGDNSAANWQDSRVANGTPGRKNSVSPAEIDIGFSEEALMLPMPIFAGDTVVVTLTLTNFGLQAVNDAVLIRLFISRNDNVIFDEDDWLIEEKSVLPPREVASSDVLISWPAPAAGEYNLMATVSAHVDEISDNNHTGTTVTVLTRETTLHINEIKFITRPNEPEWLELYNSGKKPLPLGHWGIADQSDTARIAQPVIVYPGHYIIVAADTLSEFYDIDDSLVIVLQDFPSLHNREDRVVLLSPGGGWQEIVHYHSEWLAPREAEVVSLERINPALYSNDCNNWGPCAERDGATPGRSNSLFTKVKAVKSGVEIKPNPFSPDNDGFDDVTVISGSIPESSATIRIRIYDIKGRLIRTLVKEQYSAGTFDFIWDGKDNQERTARIGIYILFIEALNGTKHVLWEFKTTVVLAQRLN